ncbi:MAG: sulfatase [Actinomycetota bacterium]|nr:sulfatase [Actinomycetota bacterium]
MKVRVVARRTTAILTVLTVAQLPADTAPLRAAHGAETPNVMIILTDDHRLDQASPRILKKTLRWFRNEGLHFPYAFAPTPLCCPARASIFTGQYAHNTRVETNIEAERLDQRATMQRYLQDAGYRTAMVGKYLHQWRRDPPYFDDWAMFDWGNLGYRKSVFNVGGAIRKVKRYSTDFIGAYTTQLLRAYEADDEQPWFIEVAPLTPHAPYDPHKRYRKKKVPRFRGNPAVREDDRKDKPQWVQAKTRGGIKRARTTWRLQQRMLLSFDTMVDKVLSTMRELGEENDTMEFFLADNGFLLGEHGLHQKHSPYSLSVQLPFYVRWPGHFPVGTTDPRVTANIDIAPTVYEAAGIEPDPEFPVDGRSLLQPPERDHVLLEYTHREDRAVPSWASSRTATYQYTEYYDEDLETVIFQEYYDLTNDPWQLTNLMADSDPNNDPPPDLITQLSIQLRNDRRCEGTEGPAACP